MFACFFFFVGILDRVIQILQDFAIMIYNSDFKFLGHLQVIFTIFTGNFNKISMNKNCCYADEGKHHQKKNPKPGLGIGIGIYIVLFSEKLNFRVLYVIPQQLPYQIGAKRPFVRTYILTLYIF